MRIWSGTAGNKKCTGVNGNLIAMKMWLGTTRSKKCTGLNKNLIEKK